jgi:AraC family transcriptional regulator
MRDLQARLVLNTPIVRVADVTCRAPRCGPGGEEGGERLELVLPRRGLFCVHRGSRQTIADANTVVVLGAAEHRVSHPMDGGDECLSLLFTPALAEEALGRAPARHGLVSPGVQLRASVLAAGNLDELEAEEMAIGLLGEVAPVLHHAPPAATVGRPGRRRVEQVRALLAAQPTRRWRLDEIARSVHCSPYHLARQFRAATGETIARYLLRLRLAAALHRIAAGETALARLAADLGFSHHSHLTARFRAAFGVTPSEARKIVTAPAAGLA